MSTTPSERLRVLLEPLVGAAGMDLEDITVTPAGKRRILRVVVDADGGVGLDDVAHLSRVLSDALDTTDAMPGVPYVLEVTSPGVDRPLTMPRHWRRARARLVKVVLDAGGELTGRVTEAGDDAVVLDVGGQTRTLPYAGIKRAAVQVEFNRGGTGDDADLPGAHGDDENDEEV
jgi:ribosome maturation factor RimP